MTKRIGVTLDEIDMAILREMNTNCRASYRALARKTDLSANAIKHRLAKLVDDRVITRFAMRLSIAMADSESFLAFVLTDGTESVLDFVSLIGKKSMVCHVSALACVSGGAYLVVGEYSGPVMLAELGFFLRNLDQVHSVELHTMLTTDLHRGRKTEVDTISGVIMEAAKHNQVPALNYEFAVALIHAMEDKRNHETGGKI